MRFVDTKGRFLGALHFDRLRDGLALERGVEAETHMSHIMVHLAEAFLVCAAGMLHGSTAKPVLSRTAAALED